MRWKKKGKRQTKEIFHSRTDQQRRPSHPLLPTRWNNTLREQTGEPLHQPRAHHCYHIWTEMGGTDGMEIPSLSSLLLLMQILFPPGPNHSYMFLFTFLHPKWDNPTCHLTQSFMHTGLFLSCRKSTGSRQLGWSVLVWMRRKMLRVGTVSLTTSHPPDRKSATLLLKIRDIFSSWSTQSSRTKSWSVLNKKRCWVKRFYKDSCFCEHKHAVSIESVWKYADALNRNLVGTRPNIIFRIIFLPPPISAAHRYTHKHTLSAVPLSVKRHILTPSLRQSMWLTKSSCLCSAGAGEGGVNMEG